MPPPIPPRSEDAPTGGRFMQNAWAYMGDTHRLSVQELDQRCRYIEQRAEAEFMSGNVPDFMRPENWPEITVERTIGGRRVQATVRVCPDYLAIGSNDDYIRIPMSPVTAQRIADHFGFALPTQLLVDIIEDESKRTGGRIPFEAAPAIAKRMGIPWDAKRVDGFWTRSPDFSRQQSRMSDESVRDLPRQDVIRSGHKKDVIYHPGTNQGAYIVASGGRRIKVADRGVAIYLRGIQPPAIPHEETFYDYSHGIRFVHGQVRLRITEPDGSTHTETMSMRDLLNHPEFYSLLSSMRMDIDTLYRTRPSVVPSRRSLFTMRSPSPERDDAAPGRRQRLA